MLGHGNFERRGTKLLIGATILVAISIILDGAPARSFNGVAGITWFAAAGMLVLAARHDTVDSRRWLTAGALTAFVAFVVKPNDFVPAVVGFGLAGFFVALNAGRGRYLWAKLVVGLYLPFHIGTAVLRVLYRNLTGAEASMRSEPPPTAALVPIVMLLAAIAGAWLAQRVQEWRSAGPLTRT